MKLEHLETGIVYRNPKPYLRAVNAWHPSLAALPNGELLASFDLGQGPESLDYRTCLARSNTIGSPLGILASSHSNWGRGMNLTAPKRYSVP